MDMGNDLPLIIIAAVFVVAAIASLVTVVYIIHMRRRKRRKYLEKREVKAIPNEYVTARELGHMIDDVNILDMIAPANTTDRNEVVTVSALVFQNEDDVEHRDSPVSNDNNAGTLPPFRTIVQSPLPDPPSSPSPSYSVETLTMTPRSMTDIDIATQAGQNASSQDTSDVTGYPSQNSENEEPIYDSIDGYFVGGDLPFSAG